MGERFTEGEVWVVIKALPAHKAPGPDGLRNLHETNDVLLVLLPKSAEASVVHDYRPITLIHLIGKLVLYKTILRWFSGAP
jgi:hypothetical protein